jgi:hypothetical protein
MWTINIRLGLAEFFTFASLLIVAGLLTVAFLSGWTIALVPAITYTLAIGATYVLYRRYFSQEAEVSRPVASVARFRVVGARGVCPLGSREGDLVTVGPAGAVIPQLCPPAEHVLRRAASAGAEPEIKEWCCPIFDHLLVFRRELKAA